VVVVLLFCQTTHFRETVLRLDIILWVALAELPVEQVEAVVMA
jgi:hypothetical protein